MSVDASRLLDISPSDAGDTCNLPILGAFHYTRILVTSSPLPAIDKYSIVIVIVIVITLFTHGTISQ